MPHFFVVANIWCAHESLKRAWPQETNTILAFRLIQQMSLKSSDNDEAEDNGTTDAAMASSGYNGKHVTSLYRLVVTLLRYLHDPANVQQTSSKCIQNTRANAGRLLDCVNTLLLNVSITQCIQSLAVTCSFLYSTFPVITFYTTFPIIDVSTNRHYLHFYSSIPLPVVSITRRFSVPNLTWMY